MFYDEVNTRDITFRKMTNQYQTDINEMSTIRAKYQPDYATQTNMVNYCLQTEAKVVVINSRFIYFEWNSEKHRFHICSTGKFKR